jgi:hypothetical protein
MSGTSKQSSIVQALERLLRVLEGPNGEPWDVDQDCRFCGGHYGDHFEECEWKQARAALDAYQDSESA